MGKNNIQYKCKPISVPKKS